VGEFDFVKNVQDELGVERRLWGVALKPGNTLAFGVRDHTLVFGLPAILCRLWFRLSSS
jgi:molybdopterin biosynthesis enzyme